MSIDDDYAPDSVSTTTSLTIGPELIARLSLVQSQQIASRKSINEVLLHNDAVLLTNRSGVAIFLRFDGKVIVWDYDGLSGDRRDPRVTEDIEQIAFGVVSGAKELQLPELRELLPKQPENASGCRQCGPERIFYNSSQDPDEWTVCPFCKGLGWTVDSIIC